MHQARPPTRPSSENLPNHPPSFRIFHQASANLPVFLLPSIFRSFRDVVVDLHLCYSTFGRTPPCTPRLTALGFGHDVCRQSTSSNNGICTQTPGACWCLFIADTLQYSFFYFFFNFVLLLRIGQFIFFAFFLFQQHKEFFQFDIRLSFAAQLPPPCPQTLVRGR